MFNWLHGVTYTSCSVSTKLLGAEGTPNRNLNYDEQSNDFSTLESLGHLTLVPVRVAGGRGLQQEYTFCFVPSESKKCD